MNGKRILSIVLLAQIVLLVASISIGGGEARNAATRNQVLAPPTEEELAQARKNVPDFLKPTTNHVIVAATQP